MEVLVALVLAMATSAPIIYWYFHNESNQSAWNRFESLGQLEQILMRQWQHPVRESGFDSALEKGRILKVRYRELDGHSLILGEIVSAKGQIEATLEMMRFTDTARSP
jgi:hypothetical protein